MGSVSYTHLISGAFANTVLWELCYGERPVVHIVIVCGLWQGADVYKRQALGAEGQISAAGGAGGAVCDPAGKAADRRKPVGIVFPPDGSASAAGGLRRRHCAVCAHLAGHGSAAPVLLSVPLPYGSGVRSEEHTSELQSQR